MENHPSWAVILLSARETKTRMRLQRRSFQQPRSPARWKYTVKTRHNRLAAVTPRSTKRWLAGISSVPLSFSLLLSASRDRSAVRFREKGYSKFLQIHKVHVYFGYVKKIYKRASSWRYDLTRCHVDNYLRNVTILYVMERKENVYNKKNRESARCDYGQRFPPSLLLLDLVSPNICIVLY